MIPHEMTEFRCCDRADSALKMVVGGDFQLLSAMQIWQG